MVHLWVRAQLGVSGVVVTVVVWPDGIWFSCGSFVCGLCVFGSGVVQPVVCVL